MSKTVESCQLHVIDCVSVISLNLSCGMENRVQEEANEHRRADSSRRLHRCGYEFLGEAGFTGRLQTLLDYSNQKSEFVREVLERAKAWHTKNA